MAKTKIKNLKNEIKQLMDDGESFLEQSETRLRESQLEAEKVLARLSDTEERLTARIAQAGAEFD